jgi:hypothetical protein
VTILVAGRRSGSVSSEPVCGCSRPWDPPFSKAFPPRVPLSHELLFSLTAMGPRCRQVGRAARGRAFGEASGPIHHMLPLPGSRSQASQRPFRWRHVALWGQRRLRYRSFHALARRRRRLPRRECRSPVGSLACLRPTAPEGQPNPTHRTPSAERAPGPDETSGSIARSLSHSRARGRRSMCQRERIESSRA